MIKNINTIILDFDGTCVTHNFPDIGKDIGAIPVLKRLVENDQRLILFTMRCEGHEIRGGNLLTQAVNWFKENDIPLYGIQRNPTQDRWTSSPKAYGNIHIDDAGLGIPLIWNPELSDRPFVDWIKVEKILEEMGVFNNK